MAQSSSSVYPGRLEGLLKRTAVSDLEQKPYVCFSKTRNRSCTHTDVSILYIFSFVSLISFNVFKVELSNKNLCSVSNLSHEFCFAPRTVSKESRSGSCFFILFLSNSLYIFFCLSATKGTSASLSLFARDRPHRLKVSF